MEKTVKINQIYRIGFGKINGSDTFVVTSIGDKVEARPVIDGAVIDNPFFIQINDEYCQYLGMLNDMKLTPDQIAVLDEMSRQAEEEFMKNLDENLEEMYEEELAMRLYEKGLEVC